MPGISAAMGSHLVATPASSSPAAILSCGKASPIARHRACGPAEQLENGELPDQPIIHDPRVKAAVIIDPYPVFVSLRKILKE